MAMVRFESRLDQIEALLAETAQHQAQTARQQAQTDQQLKLLGKQLEEFRRDTQARQQREERNLLERQKRDEQDRRNLTRQMGELSNRLGTIVEDIIAPSLRRMVEEEFDCGQLQLFGRNVEKYHPKTNLRREFDVIAVGSKAVLLNQTKAFTRPEYVKEAVEFLQSGEFFEYFPEYTGKPLIPVFASLHIPANVVTYCTRQGIYAVGMGDEVMTVLNLEAVRVLHTSA